MGTDERLKEYRSKRSFDRTSEPSGESSSRRATKPRFVVQKHKASTLHYDFRIEVDGVLKSWAIPKGPSTDPSVKRLAMPTEDHPLDYIDFEGTIPEPEYGAGTVIVWDTGTYRNVKEGDLAAAIADGQAEVWLEGKKLAGGYVLIRTGKGADARWLFKKMQDDEADARRNPVSTQPESVLSGKTIQDLEEESD